MKKHEDVYNEVFREIFHILGFKDELRDICHKLTMQTISEIIKSKSKRIDWKLLLKEYKK